MTTKWTRGAFAVAALAVVVAALSGPRSEGQARGVSFTDGLEKNMIRSSNTKVQSSVRTAYLYDGNETSASSNGREREYSMQEYVAEASQGRATTLYRSYDQFRGKDTMKLTEDSQPIETAATDARSRQTFIFSVDATGNHKLSNELLATMEAKDIHAAATDNTPMLAPSGEAKPGDSWKVSAQAFAFSGMMGAGEKLKEAEISATLEAVQNDEAGRSVAVVSYKANLKSGFRAVSDFDGSETANLEITYSIEGKAAYLVGGRMLAFGAKGSASAKGKSGALDTKIDATYTFEREFTYGSLVDTSADNGSEGPADTKDVYTSRLDSVPAGHIVLARNGSIGRLQTFDPTSRKIVKTVAALPNGLYFNDVALSRDRKRIAFRSNGNNPISIAETNIFVLELGEGRVNQITPSWATNDGIAKPLDTGKTCTVTGRIVWYDDEFRRDRNDGLNIGWVRVDHTNCYSTIDGTTGKFKLENVPANSSLLIQAFASLPNYSNGKSRGWQYFPNGKATATTLIVVDENGKDLGDWKIHPPAADYGYASPSFGTGGDVICNRYPGATLALVGYPTRTWKEVNLDEDNRIGLLTGGFSLSPDAKTLTFVRDSSGGKGAIYFFDSRGKEIWSTDLAEGVDVSFAGQSAWLADGSGVVCTSGAPDFFGKDRFGSPAVLYAAPAQKRVVVARKWPQLGGYSCKSVALNAAGTIAYLVLHFTNDKGVTYGDLWQWDSTTDTLSRLTSLGDVAGVANIGR